MVKSETKIAVGRTDGFRYVGIKPPLTLGEVEKLAERKLIREGNFEYINVEPECTLVHLGGNLSEPSGASKQAKDAAEVIAETLKSGREKIIVDLGEVTIKGYGSSPFNPDTPSR